MTADLIANIKKAVWAATFSTCYYENKTALLRALTDGKFGTDCCNFVNLVQYLHDGDSGPFLFIDAVVSHKSLEMRYCCGPLLDISNKLPFAERGQWIVRIGDDWWGMTTCGPEVRALDEWIEVSRTALASAAAAAGNTLALKVANATWTARSAPLLEDPPASAETVKFLMLALKPYMSLHARAGEFPTYHYPGSDALRTKLKKLCEVPPQIYLSVDADASD